MLNTDLTLSAVPSRDEQPDHVVSVIERELEAIDQGASPDRLIDYVWPGRVDALDERRDQILAGALDTVWAARAPVQYSRAGGRRLADRITESELRLLDGNR